MLKHAVMAVGALLFLTRAAQAVDPFVPPAPTVTLPYPALLPSSSTFFSLAAAVKPQKQVFAHYMVCCGLGGPAGTIAADEQEIITAQTMGITGFALNLGAWNSTYQSGVSNMFAAAAALNSGFQLMFSADMTGLTDANIVSMMTTYANHGNYFHYLGKPVLSTFSGENKTTTANPTPQQWWTNLVLNPLASSGINVYFVPGFLSVPPYQTSNDPTYVHNWVAGQIANWTGLVQGLHTWMALNVVANDAGNSIAVPLLNEYASQLKALNLTFMPGIITKYWGSNQTSNGNIYYEWQGGASSDGQWGAAVANDVPWVEVLTWNDFNESYMQPMDDYVKYIPWGFPTGFTKPSFGYSEMLRYYVAWFRTGVRPTIDRDAVIWFYRTHPASATAGSASLPGGTVTGPVSRYVPNSPSGSVIPGADQIYVTVFTNASGTLTVNGAAQPVSAGVNHLSFPFVAGAAPIFQLQRACVGVLNGVGADVIQASPAYYDWWNSSGFVER